MVEWTSHLLKRRSAVRSGQSHRSLSSWVLKIPRDRERPLAACCTVCCPYSKKVSPYVNLNLSCQLLHVGFHPATMHGCGVWLHLLMLEGCCSAPLRPTVLQAGQSQLPQSLLTGRELQLPTIMVALCWNWSGVSISVLYLGAWNFTPVFQMLS